MLGLPKDTFEKDIESVKMSISLKPEIARIYPALVIKDTPMEIMYKRHEYNPYTLKEAVEISKILYKMYEDNNVNVIRIGLQPTETITEGKDVIAGPFHPSFRELVEGSIYKDYIKDNLKDKKEGTVIINPKDISILYANKKMFFNELIKDGYTLKVVTSNDINRGSIKVK